MYRRKIIVFILLQFALCGLSDMSFAHKDDKEDDEWNPVSAGPITTWTAPLCGKGKFVIQPFFFYNRTRGSFDSDGHYKSLPDGDWKYQFQEQLFAQLGLTDRLEIDGQTVYQQNYIKQDDAKAHSSGFGDSYLFLRYCAFEENDWLPHMTGLFQLKMPTGKYQKSNPDKLGTDLMGTATGGGSWDPGLGINLTKKLNPFIFHADIAYSYPHLARVDGAKTIYGRYLTWDFGVECFLPKGLNLMIETNCILQGDRRQDGDSIPSSGIKYFNMSPGIGWSNDKIQTLLAYQRVMTGTNTDANDSVIFTLVYTF
ncbi:MAG: hypothetical protein A3I73_05045 [Omnitrophica bacterium RIFCSPLOWO2_02_FULL_45_16]|nr:MAG: hypothetical protein A3C51_05130 [Omnitrophica bacterium RIFCSPHIGHO2_02_FULL_46_20]OGW93764.1 MAG: hypothetical protein A3K16_02095 [Omnitrophica bacterium RIFCSPLOWO2_01_FULL_45_24]OGW94108.1 MAG: hypothetical protein A3G36_03030 [Omnitrophica bacterium RIFCSPLOWO2_12_FULL_45_13]OGX00831.1 MAG: hypothetical protein A3I73_05045 [Omnitrophica bacterium RIFCSPLOWO2_02_FULL_45_16]